MSAIEAQPSVGALGALEASSEVPAGAAGSAGAVASLLLISASAVTSCACDNAPIAPKNLWKSPSVTTISARIAPRMIMPQHKGQTAPETITEHR
jgi:hypothetical protein